MEKQHVPKSGWKHYAWNILFALFYPFLLTFSLIFTGIVWIFSGISQILFKVLSSISQKEKEDISK